MSKQSRVWSKAGDPPWGSGQYQDIEVEVGPEGRRRVSKEERGHVVAERSPSAKARRLERRLSAARAGPSMAGQCSRSRGERWG